MSLVSTRTATGLGTLTSYASLWIQTLLVTNFKKIKIDNNGFPCEYFFKKIYLQLVENLKQKYIVTIQKQ